jgi:hypothetical protein
MTRLWAEGRKIETWGQDEAPAGFYWEGGAHTIAQTYNRWQVHTLWWQPADAVWREYIKVVTGTGLLCLIYRDLQDGGWFLARVYD